MGQHTPGPWSLPHITSLQMGQEIYSESRGRVALAEYLGTTTNDEQVANACLIAAAPDLLAALDNMLATVEEGGADWQAATRQARAVIAKAKGGA